MVGIPVGGATISDHRRVSWGRKPPPALWATSPRIASDPPPSLREPPPEGVDGGGTGVLGERGAPISHALRGACPLHHPLFGGRSPSRRCAGEVMFTFCLDFCAQIR